MSGRRLALVGLVLAPLTGCATLAGLDGLEPEHSTPDAAAATVPVGPTVDASLPEEDASVRPRTPPSTPETDSRVDASEERASDATHDLTSVDAATLRDGDAGEDEFCVFSGTCACTANEDCTTPGFRCCGGRCTDLKSDARHCGSCDTACSSDKICDFGTCSCGGLDPNCAAECVDYFSNPDHCGRCGHSCQGGACIGGACQPVKLASDQREPVTVVVDRNSVYFANRAGNSLGRVPKAGPACSGSGCLLLTSPDLDQPVGMVIDQAQHIYVASYANGGDGAILQISTAMAAGSATRLASPKGPWALALAAGRVFWSSRTDTTVIGSVPVNGGAVSRVVAAPGATDTRALATDGVSLVWGTRTAAGTQTPGIFHIAGNATCSDGACPQTARVGAAQAFALDGAWLYWTSSDGCVRRMLKTGGCQGITPCPVLVAKNQPDPQAIAVDGRFVYWTNGGDGSVRHARLYAGTCDGPQCQALAGGMGTLSGIGQDDATLYLTSTSTGSGSSSGVVWKLAKPE